MITTADADKAAKNYDPKSAYQAIGDAIHAAQDLNAHMGMGKGTHYLLGALGSIITLFGLFGANPWDPHPPEGKPGAESDTLLILQWFYRKLVSYGYKPTCASVNDERQAVINERGEVHVGEDNEAHPASFNGDFCELNVTPTASAIREQSSPARLVGIPYQAQQFGVVGSEGFGLRKLESIELAAGALYAPSYRQDLQATIFTNDLNSHYGSEMNFRDLR